MDKATHIIIEVLKNAYGSWVRGHTIVTKREEVSAIKIADAIEKLVKSGTVETMVEGDELWYRLTPEQS